MKVYLAQLDIVWEDKAANFQKVMKLLESHGPEPDGLIVLPEMFATGFTMNVAGAADGGEGARFLAGLARRYHCWVLGGLIGINAKGRGLNQAIVLDPGGNLAASYTKIHPFSYGRESTFYEGGKQVEILECGGFRLCPFICYDLRFPEIFRMGVCKGADLFVVIANWPVARESHWVDMLKVRAIENLAYLVGVNRCGRDPALEYPGRSMVVDPLGGVLRDAGGREGCVAVELDLKKVIDWRKQFPALEDLHREFLAGG